MLQNDVRVHLSLPLSSPDTGDQQKPERVFEHFTAIRLACVTFFWLWGAQLRAAVAVSLRQQPNSAFLAIPE